METTNTEDLTNLIINPSTRKQIQNVILRHSLNKVLIFSGVAGTGKTLASRILAKELSGFSGINLISATDLIPIPHAHGHHLFSYARSLKYEITHHVDKIVRKNLGKVLLIDDSTPVCTNDNALYDSYNLAVHKLVKDYRKNFGNILIIMTIPPKYTINLETVLVHNGSLTQTIDFPSFSVNQLFSLADYKLQKCHYTGYHNQLKHDFKTVIPLNYLKDNGRLIVNLINDIKTVHDDKLLSNLSKTSLSDIRHLTTDDINDGVYRFLVNSSHYIKTNDVNTLDDFQRKLNKMLINDLLIVVKNDVRKQLNTDLYDVPVSLLIRSSSINKLSNCLVSAHNLRLVNSSNKNMNLTKNDVNNGIHDFIKYY